MWIERDSVNGYTLSFWVNGVFFFGKMGHHDKMASLSIDNGCQRKLCLTLIPKKYKCWEWLSVKGILTLIL